MPYLAPYDRLCAKAEQVNPDFGAYVQSMRGKVLSLGSALGSGESVRKLLRYIVTNASITPFPFLFEDRKGQFLCNYLCAASLAPDRYRKLLPSSESIVFRVSGILSRRIKEGIIPPPTPIEPEAVETGRFLWPTLNDDASPESKDAYRIIRIHTIYHSKPSKQVDRDTLTCLMLLALAFRIHEDGDDSVTLRLSKIQSEASKCKLRGIALSLYSDGLTPRQIAQVSVKKVFSRHNYDDPALEQAATIFAQGPIASFEDSSLPLVNQTGMDVFVFTPNFLTPVKSKNGNTTRYELRGVVVGLINGLLQPAWLAKLIVCPDRIVCQSSAEWALSCRMASCHSEALFSFKDVPATKQIQEKIKEGAKINMYDAFVPPSDPTGASSSSLQFISYSATSYVSIFPHPHLVYEGFSFIDKVRPALSTACKHRWSIMDKGWTEFGVYQISEKIDAAIRLPLLSSLRRRPVKMRAMSFFIADMLSKHNLYADLYHAIRSGMVCKDGWGYNILVSAVKASADPHLASRNLTQAISVYPFLISQIVRSISRRLTVNDEEDHAVTFYAVDPQSMMDGIRDCQSDSEDETSRKFAVRFGLLRDIVDGIPVSRSIKTFLDTDGRVAAKIARAKMRSADGRLLFRIGDRLLSSNEQTKNEEFRCLEKCVKISPDISLRDCHQLFKIIEAIANAMNRTSCDEHKDTFITEVINSITSKTIALAKNVTAGDIMETDMIFSSLCMKPPRNYDVEDEANQSIITTDWFYRSDARYILDDILRLNKIRHERNDVIDHMKTGIRDFRLYRPRGSIQIENPFRPVWNAFGEDRMIGNIQITHLTSVSALRREGDEMGHCVGGYEIDGWSGDILLSLVNQKNGRRSTAQIVIEKQDKSADGKTSCNYVPVVIQHRGPYNTDLNRENEAALDSYLKEIRRSQKENKAWYNASEAKLAALRRFRDQVLIKQHPEEYFSGIALFWPQLSFFMRGVKECPYQVFDRAKFKRLYRKRMGLDIKV